MLHNMRCHDPAVDRDLWGAALRALYVALWNIANQLDAHLASKLPQCTCGMRISKPGTPEAF